MPLTLTVEDGTGVADANSYVTLDEMKDYFAAVPAAADFLALDDTVLTQYAVWATRTLDQKATWKGYAATDTQALAWPRACVTDKYGLVIDSDVVPPQVKAVTSEMARWLVANNPSDGSDVSNLKQITVDVIEVIFQDQTSQTNWPTIFNQIIDGLGSIKVGGRGFPRVIKA